MEVNTSGEKAKDFFLHGAGISDQSICVCSVTHHMMTPSGVFCVNCMWTWVTCYMISELLGLKLSMQIEKFLIWHFWLRLGEYDC